MIAPGAPPGSPHRPGGAAGAIMLEAGVSRTRSRGGSPARSRRRTGTRPTWCPGRRPRPGRGIPGSRSTRGRRTRDTTAAEPQPSSLTVRVLVVLLVSAARRRAARRPGVLALHLDGLDRGHVGRVGHDHDGLDAGERRRETGDSRLHGQARGEARGRGQRGGDERGRGGGAQRLPERRAPAAARRGGGVPRHPHVPPIARPLRRRQPLDQQDLVDHPNAIAGPVPAKGPVRADPSRTGR